MYQWFVFAHLVGLVLFLMAHGTSAFVAFRMRTLRDVASVSDYLAMSQTATRAMYVGLLFLLIGGAAAATVNDFWTTPWVLGSIVVFVAVLIGMWVVGAAYYYKLRDLIAGKDGQSPISEEALAVYLDSRRPEMLLAIGLGGLIVIVWLMVLKPG